MVCAPSVSPVSACVTVIASDVCARDPPPAPAAAAAAPARPLARSPVASLHHSVLLAHSRNVTIGTNGRLQIVAHASADHIAYQGHPGERVESEALPQYAPFRWELPTSRVVVRHSFRSLGPTAGAAGSSGLTMGVFGTPPTPPPTRAPRAAPSAAATRTELAATHPARAGAKRTIKTAKALAAARFASASAAWPSPVQKPPASAASPTTTRVGRSQRLCGTPGCLLPDFHSGLCSQEVGCGTQRRGVQRRRCGTPGCYLSDFHPGPCSGEALLVACSPVRERGRKSLRFDDEFEYDDVKDVERIPDKTSWAQCDACDLWVVLPQSHRVPNRHDEWLCDSCV